MRAVLGVIGLCVLYFASYVEARDPSLKLCKEGSRWRKECNWCNCVDGQPACTELACLAGDVSDERECEVGASWKRDCNWCRCTRLGIALCTLKACAPPRPGTQESEAVVAVAAGGRGRRSPDQLGDSQECEPGSRFRQKCNWCTCSSQGLKLCSKKRCQPGADLSSEPQCEGDARYKDEDNCNWCSCHNGLAICTLKFCFT